MTPEPPELELINDTPGRNAIESKPTRVSVERGWATSAIVSAAMLAIVVWLAISEDNGEPLADESQPDVTVPTNTDRTPDELAADRLATVLVTKAVPPPLLAAELFTATPNRSTLQNLFNEIGGFEELEIAVAEGAFDIVRFDPRQPDRLLASNRRSYGEAENQNVNELWQVSGSDGLQQTLWNSPTTHDFAHFNVDGTIAMWSHSGGDDFAPRQAVVLDRDLAPIFTTAPMYASRFTATADAVFALTGNGDYYTNEPGHVDLIADAGAGPIVLGDGAPYEWIDNPTPDILVAYPTNETGVTAVWDASTLLPLATHPLAGHRVQRLAISRDGSVVVAATTEGTLNVLDPYTGQLVGSFGDVDVTGIDNPVTVNRDGTVAITVERMGRVRIWWVGDDNPIATFDADASQPRWLPPRYAPQSATAVAADAQRIALRINARSDRATHWILVDTDVSSWITRACDLADRPLRSSEANALGLTHTPLACAR